MHRRSRPPARIIDNLKEVVDAAAELTISVRVNIDERNREDIEGLIDLLVEEGLGGRPNLKMYFAPVEAMTEGCHGVQDVTMSKSRYAQLEADLSSRASPPTARRAGSSTSTSTSPGRSASAIYLRVCVNQLRAHADLRVVGFSCTFFQTVASLALGRILKDAVPDLKVVYGGACFHGEMGGRGSLGSG